MKKIIFMLAFLPTIAFAQEEKKIEKSETTLSFNALASEPSQFGLSLETKMLIKDGLNYSAILNLSATGLTLSKNNYDIKGSGFAVELGTRQYYNKLVAKGWFLQNFISHSETKFTEPYFNGKYSYWSLLNFDFGYKIIALKKIAIEPSIGYIWKWEVNTKTDLDNKDIKNTAYRVGLKIGYKF